MTENAGVTPIVKLRTSSWKTALPRGRQGWDLSGERIVFHTVQDQDAYEELRDTGVMRCKPERSEHDFAEAYQWMRSQHYKRIPGSAGGPLIWGWVRTTRRDLQSCLYRGVRYSKNPQLLLTCSLPRERVLTSEFSEWHSVLNRYHVLRPGISEEDEERQVDEFFDAVHTAGLSNAPLESWPAHLREPMEASWELIFDQSLWPRRSWWQGCVEEIYASEVRDAVALTR